MTRNWFSRTNLPPFGTCVEMTLTALETARLFCFALLMPFEWAILKPFIGPAGRAASALGSIFRDRPKLRIIAKVKFRNLGGGSPTKLVIEFKIINRGRRQIQVKQWGVRTTKLQTTFQAQFSHDGLILAENTSHEAIEEIPDEIAKALPSGAEVFCEDALGNVITQPIDVPGFKIGPLSQN